MLYSEAIYKDNFLPNIGWAIFAAGLLLVGAIPLLIGVFIGLTDSGYLAITHLFAVVTIAAVLARRNIKAALFVLVLILPWQPFLSMPLSGTVGGTGIKMLTATKEFYVAALLLVLFLCNCKKIKWGYVDRAAIFFLAIQAFYFIYSTGDFFSRLVSFREGFMIVAFYLIGRLLFFQLKDIRWLLKAILIISIPVVLFGYLERFLFDEYIWTLIGANDYFNLKYGPDREIKLINGMPPQWYTYIGGEAFRRMVGPIGYGISLSRFLAFPILSLIYIRGIIGKSKRILPVQLLVLFFLAGAQVLTLGRGGLLIVLGGVLVWLFARRPVSTIIVAILLSVTFFGEVALFDPKGGSAVRHMSGLAAGLSAMQAEPLGHGLGTSGQMAVLYSSNIIEKVSESYVGSIAYQMGLPGMAAYCLFVFSLLWKLWKTYKEVRPGKYRPGEAGDIVLLGFSIAAGIFATSLLGNAAVAPISAGVSLLYCGTLIGAAERKEFSASRA